METLSWKDFSAGWCPSDSPVGGRVNGFQTMDNIDLDINGAITLCGGSSVIYTQAHPVHSLYKPFLSGSYYLYDTDNTGVTFRNNASIITGGSTTRTAFSQALGYNLILSDTKRKKDNITHLYDLGITPPVVITLGTSAGGVLTGTYNYAAIGVLNDGTYTGKSILGPVASVSPAGQKVTIAFGTAPNVTDPQVTEAWIFRQIAGIWYRVLVVNSAGGWAGTDNMTDIAAQTLDIFFNINLVSINSASISDPILEVVGPVNGRWYYFTTNFMYPSDINDPDLVDASLAVRTAATGSEYFMWAKKVSDSVIMVGTNLDVYTLTGTFVTQSDGTIDVYYRPVGCQHPPFSIDAFPNNGIVYYYAATGPRTIDSLGNNPSIVAPNLDTVFTGFNAQISTAAPGIRTPMIMVEDRIYIGMGQDFNSVTGSPYRIFVYEIVRNYWRAMNFQLNALNNGACTAMVKGADGLPYAAFGGTAIIANIDNPTVNNLLSLTGIPFQFSSVFLDGGSPYSIKDLYTLRYRVAFVSGTSCAPTLTNELGAILSSGLGASTNASNIPLPIVKDISGLASPAPPQAKYLQIAVTGQARPSDTILSDFEVDYDVRPESQTYKKLYTNNYGSASKKRIRVMIFVLDCLGNSVTFNSLVDGSGAGGSTTFTGNGKQTYKHFFKTDIFGVDYGGEFIGVSLKDFIFYGEVQPDIVQILPIARQFDQVGPEDLFKYGRVDQYELRVLPFGTSIPYTLYFNDNSQVTGTITTVNGKEASYYVYLPKGTAGQVIRIELGPTAFDFHRFYIRARVMLTGKDTEKTWMTI